MEDEIETEGDGAVAKEELWGNKDNEEVEKEYQGDDDDDDGAPTTSSTGTKILPHPYTFHVGELINVNVGKASHQALILLIENEKATVRWMTWKGVDDVQVNQLRPICDGSKRKRQQTD